MRRAVLVLLLIAAFPFTAHAAKATSAMDGVSMINYRRGLAFKVGDWVKYKVHGKSELGLETDYGVTILIAGEEMWWGEECFWVETQVSYFGLEPLVTASCVSRAVFQDSFPAIRYPRYIRKYIDMLDSDGKPTEQLYRRSANELFTRGYAEYEPVIDKDTVGVAKVTVPKGTYDALRIDWHHRTFVTEHKPDSSTYYEKATDQTYWRSDDVPITGLARVDLVETQRTRVWKAGESENAPMRVLERATGSQELVDFGTGMKPLLVPQNLRHPLTEQRATRPKSPAPPAARKTTGTRG